MQSGARVSLDVADDIGEHVVVSSLHSPDGREPVAVMAPTPADIATKQWLGCLAVRLLAAVAV
jgi:hypothetical protein